MAATPASNRVYGIVEYNIDLFIYFVDSVICYPELIFDSCMGAPQFHSRQGG